VIPKLTPLPRSETVWERLKSPSTDLSHIHPDGFLAWHWFHLWSDNRMSSTSRGNYGVFFIPYWVAFAVLIGLARLALAHSNRNLPPAEEPADDQILPSAASSRLSFSW
jgi:hypothetical protein